MPATTRMICAAAALLASFAACGVEPAPSTGDQPLLSQQQSALFTNGDFESDAIGKTPPTGWTLLNYLNSSGVSGTVSAPPASFAALNLSGLGTAVNETYVVGGTALSQADPDLGTGQTFRFPAYGSRAARVNYQSATVNGKNRNANLIRQGMTVGLADVDPGDGQIHVRFAVAPVLENPAHAYNQQPYFFIEMLNTTRGTTLFTGFNVAGQSGVPWHTTTSVATGNATQWLDWQLVDIAPGNAALATGDQVELTIVASGCSLGGHFGRIYVDGFGNTIPGPYVSATAPTSVNAGATLAYTMHYSNGGTTASIGTQFTMVTPPNTTFASISGVTGCTTPTAGSAGTISCPLGTLNPGTQGTFTVTVNVSGTATGTIVNGNYSIGGVNEPTLLGARVTTTVNGSGTHTADIVVSKIGGTVASPLSSVRPGQAFPSGTPLYTITVTNTSTTDQIRASLGKSFTFTDVVPAAVTGVTWACTATVQGSLQTGNTATKCRDQGGNSGYNGTGNSISLSPRLGYNGGQITILVYGTVSASATGSLVNTAIASAPSGITDPNLVNNTSTVTLPIGTPGTLNLTKAGGNGNGSVTSSPVGINCGTTCGSQSATFLQGTQVILFASPVAGASFTGWTGCTSNPTATECSVTMAATSNVTATFAAAPPPTPAAAVYVYGGNNQSTRTSTAFPLPLQALVTDAAGTPKSGVTVTFAVPGSGAGATVSSTTATTNSFGIASVTATANATAGTYPVTASVSGVATPATFTLTNVGAPYSITYVNGGSLTDPQVAPINGAFGAPLVAVVKDSAGNVIPGTTVTYAAVPVGGASATLSSTTAATDASGLSSVTAVANATVGSYTVTARVAGVTTPATFYLQNATTGPASVFVVSGTPQTAATSSPFTDPLVVVVADASGNSLPNITVTFTATTAASGATASLSASTAVTRGLGLASVTATANAVGGVYTVSASVSGVTTHAVFTLGNDGGYSIQVAAGSPQTTIISTAFGSRLQALVLDGLGDPAADELVTFQAPTSGATATLSDGAACVPATAGCMTAITDPTGIAMVSVAANATSGHYSVVATSPKAPGSASFNLSNECTANSQCSGTQPICDLPSGACIACPGDAACLARSGATPYCDVSGACVGCLTDSQCSGSAPICNQASNACSACSTDAQCANKSGAAPFCVVATGACSVGFTITASAGANGMITPSGAQRVGPGGTLAFAIAASANYHIADVLVDGASVGAVAGYTFTDVQASHTISASYTIDTFTITPSSGPDGGISPSTPQTVNYGDSKAFAINPATGYHVADVLVDGTSVGAVTTYTFNDVQASHTIAATFAIDTFTITPSSGPNGGISPSTPQTVNYGDSKAFAINPATGYHVADVLVDGTSVGAVTTYTFTDVQASHTIAATFAIDTFTITASSGGNGTITPSGAQTVNYGDSKAFAINPATGYHVADVLVDGTSVGAVTTYTFTNVQASHTIAATFAIDTFTITPSSGPNGGISPSTPQTVNYGDSKAFAINPATGYHVADVRVDGTSVGAVTTYTFTDVQASHTLAATFAIDTFTITVTSGTGGTVSCPAQVNYGQPATCTVTPAGGWVLETFTDNGSNQYGSAADGSYVIASVTGPHAIVATFSRGFGTGCSGNGDCHSGHCADGVCCNTACGGQCEACNLQLAMGTCSPVSGAPATGHAACSTDGSLCGGSCNGGLTTACTYSTSECRAAACDSGTATIAANCDGAGTCPALQTTPCGAYQCGASACLATCANESQCVSGDWCSNGTCLPKGDNGHHCTGDEECTNGHCVDGVCCDGVCGGQCEACNLQASVGTCTPVLGLPVGDRTACFTDGSGCGGYCDGILNTGCTYRTTQCRQPSCSNGIATAGASCDGAGSCPTLQTQTCAPFVCGSTACLGDCQLDTDCAPGRYCSAGVCVPRLDNGAHCAGDNQCANGFCTDGVCCDAACDGQCAACNLAQHLGFCTPVNGTPVGARTRCGSDGSACGGACNGVLATACTYPTDECRAASCQGGAAILSASCDGQGACPAPQTQNCSPYVCGADACLGNCEIDADCETGRYCAAGVCVIQLGGGSECARTRQCASGFCTDNVCCEGTCDGQCQACNVANHLGSCAAVLGSPVGGRTACATDHTICGGTCDGIRSATCAYPATECRAAACSEGTATLVASCDGQGACPALQTRICAPFLCGPDACLEQCANDADCEIGWYCLDGGCLQKKPDGSDCNGNNECVGSICADGVCCGTSCDGQCEACNVDGHAGQCTPVDGLPHTGHAACATDGTACGGYCDGFGTAACVFPTSSTACQDDGNENTLDLCNGTGACVHPLKTQCVVDGTIVEAGTLNPARPCQACVPATSAAAWTDLAAASPCPDDGLACTTDSCDGSGTCLHLLVAGCIIDAACVAAGATSPNNDCLDCNPALLFTGYSPESKGVACADDGLSNTLDVCDGAGKCTHPVKGECVINEATVEGGTPNPDNVCQSCDPATTVDAWTNRVVGFPCTDDGLDCTSDVCDDQAQCGHAVFRGCLVDHACVAEAAPDPANECQACDPTQSMTAFSPREKGFACTDDGDPATSDQCDGAGTCTHTTIPVEPTPDTAIPDIGTDTPLPDRGGEDVTALEDVTAVEVTADVPPDATLDLPGPDAGNVPSYRITGGPCSAAKGPVAGPAATLIVLALSLLVLLAVRSRRRPFDRTGPWIVAGLAAGLVAANDARAQQLDAQAFHPSPFATDLFTVETGRSPVGCGWNVGLLLDYQRDPLEARFTDAAGHETRIHAVRDRLTGALLGAVRIVDWFALGVSFPIVIFQDGDGLPGAGKPGTGGIGDLRLYPRFRVVSALDGHLTLSLTPGFTLPTGRLTGDYNGYKWPTFVPTLGLGMDLGRGGIAGTLGLRLTRTDTMGQTDPSRAFTWGVGGWIVAVPRTLDVIGEMTGSATLGKGFTDITQAPIELDVGVRWRVAGPWKLTAGLGTGLTRGYGAPVVRTFLGVTYECEPRAAPQAAAPERDTDGDGIPDSRDTCPDVPGLIQFLGCPDPDPDHDGLCDPWVSQKGLSAKFQGVCHGSDNCPADPEDKDGHLDEDGCPDPDNDGDGICDPWVAEKGLSAKYAPVCRGVDLCPDQPETVNGFEDEDGCPDVKVDFSSGTYSVPFPYSSDQLMAAVLPTLDAVIKVLKDRPDLAHVRIEGHTDERGGAAMNAQLSRDRAKAVRQYLIDHGIAAGRLVSEGYASTRPVVRHATTEEDHQKNRRVDFVIIGK